MAAPLLWLLSLGALAVFSSAQDSYDSLPDTYKAGVDLALKKLASHDTVLHHFLFFKSVTKSDFEAGFDVSYIYHHFYLKATKCQKGTIQSAGCQFRNDRPLMDCAVCYKAYRGRIEAEPKPYIHCMHKPAVTEEMRARRAEHCNRLGYNSGTPTLLLSTGNQ